jgi:hypothetical protein
VSAKKEDEMRRALALAAILGAAWAAVAAADGGGPSPGPTWGSPGVVDRAHSIRYVALPAGTRNTLLTAVSTRNGDVARWKYLRGSYGIPAVAWDWSTGGLARSGHRLLLVSGPGPKWTRFLVLHPQTLRVRSHFRLHGAWAFDTLSPGGSLLYLIQYRGSQWAINASYAVRAYNLNTHRLYPGAIVDRREPDEKMTGQPVTRVEPGAWTYTLYSRTGKRPFVHALDTAHRRAFCVDLPWRNSARWINGVRMRVRGGELLLRRNGNVIARVDRETLEVRS